MTQKTNYNQKDYKKCECCGGMFYGEKWAACCGPCAAAYVRMHEYRGEEENDKA